MDNPRTTKRVYIVILNWNGCQDTVECVESCRRLIYPESQILIVDNGSTDGSEVSLNHRWADVEFLQTGANLGYAGGNNAGIKHALEQGAAYVWLLNNDTVVDPECLTHLVRAAESDERVGVVGSKIYYLHEPKKIWSAGGSVDLRAGGMTRHIGKDVEDQNSYDRPTWVDYVSGCSMLLKKEALSDVGLLDENYFLYFEDADLCLRAAQKGWKVAYDPRAKLWHKEGAQTAGDYSPAFIYYSLRNRLYFMKRFAPDYMFRCHWLQLRMFLFFLKNSVGRGPRAVANTLMLGVRSYIDFYLRKAMGPGAIDL